MTTQLFLTAGQGEHLDVLGSAMTFLATAADTGGAYEAVIVESGPGGDIIPHRHPWEELYLLLEGTMDVQVGRQVRAAGPGTFLTLPARCLHGFRVTSERARFLHLSIGAGAIAAFRDYAEALPHPPGIEDLDTVLAVNARHGVELVLPDLEELAAMVGGG